MSWKNRRKYRKVFTHSEKTVLQQTAVRLCSPSPTENDLRPGNSSVTIEWIRRRWKESTGGNRRTLKDKDNTDSLKYTFGKNLDVPNMYILFNYFAEFPPLKNQRNGYATVL